MKSPSIRIAVALATSFVFAVNANAANIMYALRNHPDNAELSEGDLAQIELLEGWGHTLEFWDNAQISADPTEAILVANESDLLYISESISSGRMSTLSETTSPLISNENYGCDSLGVIPGKIAFLAA